MNIVFMGTPDFAVPTLEKLVEKYNVKAVFTQPDRPKGRGKKLAMSPVKEAALKYEIPVFQPEKLRKDEKAIEELKRMNPDFIVVVAYGQILTEEVLNIPKYACINVHASLLPKYRGAAPLNWVIINGEKKSGITTMLMGKGIDTGDMLLKCEVPIDDDMTVEVLHDTLKEKGAELLIETLEGYKAGNIIPEKQDDSESSYAPMISKDTGKINWKEDNEKINNLVRGLCPFPGTHTSYKDNTMKIYKVKTLKKEADGEPGLITSVDDNGIEVNTGKGKLLITSVQFPGKKIMSVKEYIKGNTIEKGIVLK